MTTGKSFKSIAKALLITQGVLEIPIAFMSLMLGTFALGFGVFNGETASERIVSFLTIILLVFLNILPFANLYFYKRSRYIASMLCFTPLLLAGIVYVITGLLGTF